MSAEHLLWIFTGRGKPGQGWLRRPEGDGGMGMIVVIGTVMVMSLLLAVLPVALRATLQARVQHQVFNQSLDAAEAGVDATLAALKENNSYSAGPTFTLAAGQTESAWARSTLLALAAAGGGNLVSTPSGQYVAIRPANVQTIYAIGFMPSYQHATRIRVLKANYAFPLASPDDALLTNGDLSMSGSLTITTASGVTASANVHSNGDIYDTASSNSVSISGTVEAVGLNQYSGGASGVPVKPIPTLDPEYEYRVLEPQYAPAWYDLCPGGVVKMGSANGPCTGSTPASLPSGWAWSFSSGTPDTWTESGGTGHDGVYFVYHANAVVDLKNTQNGDTIARQTIFTDSSANMNTTACPKPDGSLTVKDSYLRSYIPGIILFSGNDLTTGSNTSAVGGLAAAQDGISLTTSSAPGIQGYVIAGDMCPLIDTNKTVNQTGDSNSVQGTTINYDNGTGFPAPGTIDVTRELEL